MRRLLPPAIDFHRRSVDRLAQLDAAVRGKMMGEKQIEPDADEFRSDGQFKGGCQWSVVRGQLRLAQRADDLLRSRVAFRFGRFGV